MKKVAILLFLALPHMSFCQQSESNEDYYLIILDGQEKYRSRTTGEIIDIEDINVVKVNPTEKTKAPLVTSTPKEQTEQNNAIYTKYHTVEAKETLFSIAKRYGLTVEALRKQNNMTASSVLKVGQLLRIEPQQGPSVSSEAMSTSSNKNSKKRFHTVVKGDTLFNISKRYDLSVEQLKQLNNLSNNTIKIGQQLIINQD